MTKKLTTKQVQEYLDKYNPLSLAKAKITLISKHNHLGYRVEKDNKVYCLRMINPEAHRAGEWLSMAEEYTILKHLEPTQLGPKAYYIDSERFVFPLQIQEFISDAKCFKEIKHLSKEQLSQTAKAIALLNSQDITPDNFPFNENYTRYSYMTSVINWRMRLETIKESKQKDVLSWAGKIEKVINKAQKILEKFDPVLQKAEFVFNFDGAHCGNTYWRNDKTFFMDWQKVSYGDPSFTLARFLTSLSDKGEAVLEKDKDLMINAYLKQRQVPDFKKLIEQRIFERGIADAVWVLWNFIKSGKKGAVEKKTSIKARYALAQKLLENY